MGNSLVAEGKLQFYPTDVFETHRLLGLLGRIEIDYFKKTYLKEYYTEKGLYQELACKSLDFQVPIEYVYFDKWLNEKDYDSIKTYCEYNFGYKDKFPITICDGFAGESKWLESFKTVIPENDHGNNILLIANELETNRYNSFVDNKNIDDKYNKSFEELNLPRNSVALFLFNPPYSSSNSERNCKRYLRMILDRQILYNPSTSKDYKTGYIVCVIRKDDFLDSLDILSKNFDILKKSIYKTNPEEYAKFKQYIFIVHLKRFPYDFSNTMQAMDFQKQYNDVKEIILSEPEFNLRQYNIYQSMNYPYIDYDTAKENNKYIEAPEIHISKNDSIWKWVKGITELKDLGEEKLVVPKPLKLGEISNLLASGMINGEISLEDGTGKHVAIGGTKSIEKKEITNYKDDNGDKITETKVIRMSLPYLNILCSDNGKLVIKELGGNE
jgi:hypothetical protein